MAARYDLESALLDTLVVLQDNLNDKIAAIDAEKTAAGQELIPALAAIDNGAYHVQSLINKVINTQQFCFYGIEKSVPLSSGQVTAEVVNIYVTIGVLDNAQTNDAYRRTLRYIRALKEIFEENFSAFNGASKIKIETLTPVSLKLSEDSSEEYKLGGVSLQVGLA